MLVAYSKDPKYKEPPLVVRIGMKVIELPDAETQRRGFESVHARALVASIPGYKWLRKKGKKR